jgi:hypothetical protein
MPSISAEDLARVKSEIIPLVKGDWEGPKAGDPIFGPDQVIAAFEAGYAKGTSVVEKLVREKIEQNIQKAGSDTGKLIERLQQAGLSPKSARLKIVGVEEYEVLVVLPEKDYVDEKFDDALSFIGELERATRQDDYCIMFTFCPESESFDESKVKSDGFTLFHKSLVK